jgi:hypothetical protein
MVGRLVEGRLDGQRGAVEHGAHAGLGAAVEVRRLVLVARGVGRGAVFGVHQKQLAEIRRQLQPRQRLAPQRRERGAEPRHRVGEPHGGERRAGRAAVAIDEGGKFGFAQFGGEQAGEPAVKRGAGGGDVVR